MRRFLLRILHWILKHLETPETLMESPMYISGYVFMITRIDLNYSYIDQKPKLVIEAVAVDGDEESRMDDELIPWC